MDHPKQNHSRQTVTKTRALRWALGVLLLIVAQACDCDCTGTPPGNDSGVPGGDSGPVCTAGTVGCPCDDGTCGTDLVCEASSCVACEFGTRGCPCDEGSCQNGDVCDQTDSECRAQTECENTCAQYQECTVEDGADPVCLESCLEGYQWVPATSSCVAIPSCDANDPGFLECGDRVCEPGDGGVSCGGCDGDAVLIDGGCVENDCDAICPGRECLDPASDGGPIQCGDCVEGAILDTATGNCVDLVTCAELNCASNEFCIEAQLPATDAVCRQQADCPTGQVDPGDGACVSCVDCYSGANPLPGVTGIGNGGYAWSGKCVCQLAAGYFQETLGTVKPCDADGDGWVNASLELTRSFQGGQNPFAANQQCTVRKVDSFELLSDDSQPTQGTDVRAAKLITVDEIVAKYALTGVPTDSAGFHYVELLEPSALDEPDAFTDRYVTAQSPLDGLLHNYGGHSDTLPDAGPGDAELPPHWLVASEVNPLTKMCNHDDDDLNWDGVPDVEQSHDYLNAAQLRSDTGVLWQVFYRMAYFMELNRGYWRENVGDFDTYVIAEKSRLLGPDDAAGLELTFPETGLTDYWKTCARGRSPDYNTGLTKNPPDWNINNDFGGWYEECANPSGACEIADGNGGFRVPYDGRMLATEGSYVDPAADMLSGGGLRWPGMNHSSQFKCVSFSNSIDPPSSVAHRTPPADYLLESCRLEPRDSDSPAAGVNATNPADPAFQCEPLDPATDTAEVNTLKGRSSQNYFVAIPPKKRTTPSDPYLGGCIDEGVEWQHLCIVESEPTDEQYFGELFCSCGQDRAGVLCEIGCPDRYRFSNRAGNPATFALEGYWACLRPSASDGTVLGDPGVGYSIRGGVPAEVTPTTELCEAGADGGCAPSGYRIGPWVD